MIRLRQSVKTTSFSINNKALKIEFHKSIFDIKEQWDTLAGDRAYAQSSYAQLLEDFGPIGYQYYYALVYQGDDLIAQYYFQNKEVHLSRDFRIHTHSKNILSRLRVSFLKNFFKLVKHQILVSGNVLLTGEYAYRFKENQEAYKGLTDKVIDGIKDFIREVDGHKIQSVLSKDYYIDKDWKKVNFDSEGFTELIVQPDMVIKINPEWEDFDGYLKAVKSKYRVKFKKVLKKANALVFKELNYEELERYNDEMYSLYLDTAERALFSLFTLHPKYFLEFKRLMGDRLVLTAVFLDEKLVGFYTFLKNAEMGDAHFLGYDVRLNSKHQLYFNILLRLINTAIKQRVTHLNLSRTALEIKSSVGAEPYDMNVYLRHEGWLNKTLPFILSKTVPENDWVQRRPFK